MQFNQTFWSHVPNTFETAIINIPPVVGEGDVVSHVTPDGIIQYFFMPVSQSLPYYVQNPTIKYSFNNTNSNVTPWFVRSITNPPHRPVKLTHIFVKYQQRLDRKNKKTPSYIIKDIITHRLQTSMTTHPYQKSAIVPFQTVTTDNNQDCNFNMTNSGFQLKFHNDTWTSTTDLYYFFPGSRQYNWIPKTYQGSTAVQVDLSMLTHNICRCKIFSDKTGHCQKKSQTNIVNFVHEDDSCMSVEEARSKCKMKHKNSYKHCTKKVCKDKKSNKMQLSCECDKMPAGPETSDKLVTTYVDQETGCPPEEAGRETQTIFRNNSCTNTMTSTKGNNLKKKVIQASSLNRKSSKAKKPIKSDLLKTNSWKSDNWSGITSDSCDCYSETE